MVHIVARIEEGMFRHGGKLPFRVHAAELVVAKIGARRLHGVDRSFCQMQRHWPVVGNRIHDVRHPGMDCCLCTPRMGADEGHVLCDVAEERHQKLAHLLVACVVGELAESFAVERLPEELVEEGNLLRDLRALGIEAVLPGDGSRSCRAFE